MITEISMLKDIYFLLAVITASLSLIVIICFITLLIFLKKAFQKIAKERMGKRLSILFERNKTEEIINICDEIIKDKPNNTLALLYLVKSYYMRQELMRTKDYLMRLKNVDPASETGYAKAYWSKINE